MPTKDIVLERNEYQPRDTKTVWCEACLHMHPWFFRCRV